VSDNSNDEEVNEEVGDKVDGDEADENVNMEEGVEKIVEEIVEEIMEEVIEKILRTRSGREVKKGKISLSYHGEMEDKRKKGLGHKAKFKVVRYLTRLI
jgi:hypothetical protein